MIQDVLFEPVTVREGDRTKQMSALEAVLKKTLSKALAGDNKSALTILGIAKKEGILAPAREQAVDDLSETDLAIMRDVKRRLEAPAPEQSRSRLLTINLQSASRTVNNIVYNSPKYTEQELLRVFLRQDLCAFVQKVFETVNPGVTFSQNWSTEAVTHALQKVVNGSTTRLIINIPPRNLKSICSSVALPAFLLGHDPTRKLICVSYSDDLAAKFSNDCRAVMRSEWYRRTFPRHPYR